MSEQPKHIERWYDQLQSQQREHEFDSVKLCSQALTEALWLEAWQVQDCCFIFVKRIIN